MAALPRFRNGRGAVRETLAGLAGAMLLAGAPACVAADPGPLSEIKVSVATGPALPLGRAAERWAQHLTESANSRYVAKLYPGASLAGRDAARELATLKDGKADLAVGSALQWSLQVPALGVFSLPWIAPEPRALEALASSEPLRSALASRLEAQGVALVALAPLGYREVATMSRAIRGPADLKGLRLRASASPMLHEMLLALGALPQAMPFAEAQGEFAKGTLDGQEGPPTALAAARAAASGQRYLTGWGAIGDAMVFVVRKALWDVFTEPERENVRRAARLAITDAGAVAQEDAAVRRLGQNGVGVIRITAAGHDAFRAAVRDVSARWRGAVGSEIVKLADDTLAETAISARGETAGPPVPMGTGATDVPGVPVEPARSR